MRVASLVAELVRGGGIDPRLASQEKGETYEDAYPDEAEISRIKTNFLEAFKDRKHASLLSSKLLPTARWSRGGERNKSKGKTQSAKRRSITPTPPCLDNCIPCRGFAFCALRFDF